MAPRAGSHLTAFGITLALVIPVCLTAARLFAAVFETPFRAVSVTPAGAGRPGPVPAPPAA